MICVIKRKPDSPREIVSFIIAENVEVAHHQANLAGDETLAGTLRKWAHALTQTGQWDVGNGYTILVQ